MRAQPRDRYQIVTWHGEGNTLFHVVDSLTTDDGAPDVVITYQTADGECRQDAEVHCASLNRKAGAR